MLNIVKTQITRRGFWLTVAAVTVVALVAWIALGRDSGSDAVEVADSGPAPVATDEDRTPDPTAEATPSPATNETTDEATPEPATDPPTRTADPTDQTQNPSDRPTLATEEQDEIPRESLAAGGGSKSATNLSARSECNPATGVAAQLTWSLAADRGDAQRVAITQYADGMETQRFTLSPELSPDTTQHVWSEGLEPGILYRWEVLTRHSDLYTRSVTETFRGADCFADS